MGSVVVASYSGVVELQRLLIKQLTRLRNRDRRSSRCPSRGRRVTGSRITPSAEGASDVERQGTAGLRAGYDHGKAGRKLKQQNEAVPIAATQQT